MRVGGRRDAEQVVHEAEEIGAVVPREQLQRSGQVLVANREQTIAGKR